MSWKKELFHKKPSRREWKMNDYRMWAQWPAQQIYILIHQDIFFQSHLLSLPTWEFPILLLRCYLFVQPRKSQLVLCSQYSWDKFASIISSSSHYDKCSSSQLLTPQRQQSLKNVAFFSSSFSSSCGWHSRRNRKYWRKLASHVNSGSTIVARIVYV